MSLHRDKVVQRATLASKVAGKRTRKRLFTRDLRGRFSRAKETSRSPGSFTNQVASKKIRPTGTKLKS